MILVQLMFIAAMAIFAGSFLSFPVACLLVFVLLPFGLAGDYLADAAGSMGVDLGATLCRYVVTALRWLVPNFDSLSPSEALVGGLAIPWDLPGLAPVAYAMAGILAVLGGACLIWRSRELARVQV